MGSLKLKNKQHTNKHINTDRFKKLGKSSISPKNKLEIIKIISEIIAKKNKLSGEDDNIFSE